MSAKTCVKVAGGPASTPDPEPLPPDPEPVPPVLAPDPLPVALAPELLPVVPVPESLPLPFPLEPELLPVVLPAPDTLPLVTAPLALPLVPLSVPEVVPEALVVPEVVFPAVLPAPELPAPELPPDSPPGNVAGDELHAAKRPVPMKRAAITKLVRNEVVIEFSLSRVPGREKELSYSHYPGWPTNVTAEWDRWRSRVAKATTNATE